MISAQNISYDHDPNDLDDDCLPDDWERANGLSASDNGRTARSEGQFGDRDHDGLANGEEWRLGTRPDRADTDGDGIDDRVEVQVLKTDALRPDVNAFHLVSRLDATHYVAATGSWASRGASVVNASAGGSLDYSIHLQTANVYLLGVDYETIRDGRLAGPYDLVLSIDGHHAGRKSVTLAPGEPGRFRVMTPWMEPGPHTIRVELQNAHPNRLVEIKQITFEEVLGPDQDGNGRADWVDARLSRYRSTGLPGDSRVSPVCIEGFGRHDAVYLNGLEIFPEPNQTWFANVVLDEQAPTTLELRFPVHRESGAIAWTPTDVLFGGETVLRSGDALLLTAGPTTAGGGYRLNINGEQVGAGAPGEIIPFRFDSPGEFWVRATANIDGQAVTGTHRVTVVGGRFAADNWFAKGHLSHWDNPELPGSSVLEFDDHVRWERLPGESPVSLMIMENAPAYAIARVAEGGPILAQRQLRVLEALGGTATGRRKFNCRFGAENRRCR